jgi:hypothetical protein
VTFKFLHKPAQVISVQVEKATCRDLTETVVANGRIQPVTQVVISPEIAGEIIELPVVEGQVVKKGELLVQIKRDNYIARPEFLGGELQVRAGHAHAGGGGTAEGGNRFQAERGAVQESPHFTQRLHGI